ncbi:hypothetical protein GEMRC1_002471 [Eukaryota sp. GEM-RC1]
MFQSLFLFLRVYVIGLSLTYTIFFIQYFKAHSGILNPILFRFLVFSSLSGLALIPGIVLTSKHSSPLVIGLSLVFILALFMKCFSFIRGCRLLCLYNKGRIDYPYPELSFNEGLWSEPIDNTNFPGNVSLKNFSFFLIAPTFVYQPAFELKEDRSISSLLFLSLLLWSSCFAAYFILVQFFLPVLDRSDLTNPSISTILSSVIQLLIPANLVWLLGFFAIFHCGLGICAEVLRFKSDGFYGSWWNSTTLEDFWRDWNTLTHRWLKKHVYDEGRNYFKLKKLNASLLTFFCSAVFHELIMAFSFKVIRPYFFIAMVMQCLCIPLSKSIGGKMPLLGNVLCWLNLIIGQPLITVLYFGEYYSRSS